jgi:hypothetical protein
MRILFVPISLADTLAEAAAAQEYRDESPAQGFPGAARSEAGACGTARSVRRS